MARAKKMVTAEDAKKKLGITSFRELSGEKVIELLNSLGDTNPEGQVPCSGVAVCAFGSV